MAKPKKTLSYEEMTAVISYDPTSGEFAWRGLTGHRASTEVGYIDPRGKKFIRINRTQYPAARLAWFYVTCEWPDQLVVTKNGDDLDLRFDNLRQASYQDVSRESRNRENTSSGGVRGVSWDKSKGRWVAGITINYRRKFLGNFDTKEEASKAYLQARQELHGVVEHEAAMVADAREKARVQSRYRGLWKRTMRDAANLTGWSSIEEFASDIGSDLRDHLSLAPIDKSRPIGPGNWKWDVTLYSKFDMTTKEGRNAYERAQKRESPHIWRDRHFRQNFGISLVDYMAKLDAQGGVCACCGRPETQQIKGETRWLCVDHCHASGAIRDLLCSNCNKGLGLFADKPVLLRKAAEYLERHASKSDGDASSLTLDKERDAHHGDHSP